MSAFLRRPLSGATQAINEIPLSKRENSISSLPTKALCCPSSTRTSWIFLYFFAAVIPHLLFPSICYECSWIKVGVKLILKIISHKTFICTLILGLQPNAAPTQWGPTLQHFCRKWPLSFLMNNIRIENKRFPKCLPQNNLNYQKFILQFPLPKKNNCSKIKNKKFSEKFSSRHIFNKSHHFFRNQ